jgi:protein SCO1/2
MKFAALAALTFTLIACQPRTSKLAVYYDVPEFHLISQDGQPFDSKLVEGKIWVAELIYTNFAGAC